MKFYRIICLVIGLLGLLTPFELSAVQLSRQSQISLLTCAPGGELYSVFGHSAIRIIDPLAAFDKVYNYGTFNFSTPGFAMKFARGQLPYRLSIQSYENFVSDYRYEERSVFEQILDLTPEQLQYVFDFLEENYLPENREYPYDFFFDNCATRIRDVFESIPGATVEWGDESDSEESLRDLITPYLKILPWTAFGIDIGLGSPSDQLATVSNRMFLPDHMETAFRTAVMNDEKGAHSLVKSDAFVFQIEKDRSIGFFMEHYPEIIFWILFLLLAYQAYQSALKIRRGEEFRKYWGIDIAWFMLLGIMGLVIFFLWFLTDHDATKVNWTILWTMPLHLFFAIGICFKGLRQKLKPYFWFAAGTAILFLLSALMPHRIYELEFLPIILIILIRAYMHLFVYSKGEKRSDAVVPAADL